MDDREFKDNLRLALKETRESWRTTFSEVILITSNFGGRGSRELMKIRERRYSDFFKSYGWQQFSMIYLKNELPHESLFMKDVECI